MTTPNLGRLITVQPREVWVHEAHQFTPWLLANVDVLNDLLDMDLELDEAEYPVGDFSLDLMGHNRDDASVVIVENQLEQSDHAHLGQVLTYAAGTNAKTIVWVAKSFRDEHRAALDWLNEHTDPDTRFFAVEIQVVRIDDSAPAPNFRLVAQPNDWGKQVRAATNASPRSEEDQLYWDFWKQFRSRVKAEKRGWLRDNLGESRYAPQSDLPAGTKYTSLCSRFLGGGGLRLEIYFKAKDPALNLARFEALQAKKDHFERELGERAEWDEMPDSKDARVYVTSPFQSVVVADQDKWPAMIDWLMDQHVRFKRAIDAVGGLSSLT